MLVPSTVTMKTGNRLWIISDEMSISRLTNPSAQMAAGRRVTVAEGGLGMRGVEEVPGALLDGARSR